MRLTLVNKRKEAEDAYSFFWEADPAIVWRPGQYLYYTLDLPEPDPRGNVRHFTIASSPTEQIIQLTTKVDSSLFKKILTKLEVGSVIQGSGPRGDFVLDEERENLQVFLAGGIGITPFRAFIKYAIDKGFKTAMNLIYSNSIPEEIVFKDELDEFIKQMAGNLLVNHTITKPEETKVPWAGLSGRINAEMIQKLLATGNWKLETITFWVCGPPAFVGGMQDELQKLGISPERIEIEQFTGY